MHACRSTLEDPTSAIDASFIRGLASLNGRLLILTDIEALMTSPDMALVDKELVA